MDYTTEARHSLEGTSIHHEIVSVKQEGTGVKAANHLQHPFMKESETEPVLAADA